MVLAGVLMLAFYAISWVLLYMHAGQTDLGYTLPIVAVMLAAQGATWGRKLGFATATLAVGVLMHALMDAAGLTAAVNSVSAVRGIADRQVLLVAVDEVLSLAVPFAALALFVGRRPSLLWTARSR